MIKIVGETVRPRMYTELNSINIERTRPAFISLPFDIEKEGKSNQIAKPHSSKIPAAVVLRSISSDN